MSYLYAMGRPKRATTKAQNAAFGEFLKRVLRGLDWTYLEVQARGGPDRNVVARHIGGKPASRNARTKYAEAFRMEANLFEHEASAASAAIERGQEEAAQKSIRRIIEAAQLGGDGLPPGSPHDPFSQSPQTRASWIPRLGAVAAGKPTDFELNVLGDKDVPPSLYNSPAEHPATIIAHGHSMSPLIEEGDVVVIARRFWRQPQSGDVVAVSLAQENGHTIKWLEVLPDGRLLLKPRNENHPTRTVAPDEIKAMAVVVGWYHPVHRPRASVKVGSTEVRKTENTL